MVALGQIGKSGNNQADTVNNDIKAFIPEFEKLLESGKVKPMKYEQIGDVGVPEILKGLEAFNTRKSDGAKLVVKVAAE
jgi:hypothetical protein